MPVENNSDTQELLNLIGEDAFTRLCMVFGGTRLHITNSERSLQRLSVITGADLAEKLISHYQGTTISLSKLSSLEIAKRHQSVVSDLEKGMSQRDVALKYDMTERNVRIIKAKHLK